jgi:hypothetical protein
MGLREGDIYVLNVKQRVPLHAGIYVIYMYGGHGLGFGAYAGSHQADKLTVMLQSKYLADQRSCTASACPLPTQSCCAIEIPIIYHSMLYNSIYI